MRYSKSPAGIAKWNGLLIIDVYINRSFNLSSSHYIHTRMIDYLNSIKARDPAAKSILSVNFDLSWVKAVFFHHIANFFYIAGFDLLARIISQLQDFLQVLKFILVQKLEKIYL